MGKKKEKTNIIIVKGKLQPNDMLDALAEVARGKYCAFQVTNHYDGKKTDCYVYLDGYGSHTAATFIRALNSLKRKMRATKKERGG